MRTVKQLLEEATTGLNQASTTIKICCVVLRSIRNSRVNAKVAKLKAISTALDDIVKDLKNMPPLIAVPGKTDDEA